MVHDGGIAPVHLHSFATQPQPQPQSELAAQVLAGVMHLVLSLLQPWPAGHAWVTVHCKHPKPSSWQLSIAEPAQRSAPDVGQGFTQVTADCDWHVPARQMSPEQGGPHSISMVQLDGIAPVHLHSLVTQAQPQPQSALDAQVFDGVTQAVPSALQASPFAQRD